MNNKFFFIALLFCFIGELYAEQHVERPDYYISYGKFSEQNDLHKGNEISLLSHNDEEEHDAMRVSFVTNFASNEKEMGGMEVTRYFYLEQSLITPYIGIGFSYLETNECTDEDEECREDLLLAIYPEVAVAVNLSKLHLFFYARHYYDDEGTDNGNTYGLNLGFRF